MQVCVERVIMKFSKLYGAACTLATLVSNRVDFLVIFGQGVVNTVSITAQVYRCIPREW